MIEIIKESDISNNRFIVKCECGIIFEISKTQFNRNCVNSCGCKETIPNSIENLIGRKFEKITVLKYCGKINRTPLWLCRCDCKFNTTVVYGSNLLKAGDAKSCKCIKYLKGILLNQFKSEYNSYRGMLDRCFNKNSTKYKNYGGRGIIVCDRWKKSFENFCKDMGHKPALDYSIERINVNDNYEPSNCKWIHISKQTQNQTTTIFKNIEQVNLIKELYLSGISVEKISEKTKISITSIYRAINSDTWLNNVG